MRAIILVGGEGTRLRPLTLSRPKALMPVVGRPLLEWMLLWLKKHGVGDVLLALGYQPAPIKRVFGSGKALGLRIEYVHEKHPLGTGGAIRNASHFIRGTTLVLNGDVLTNVDIGRAVKLHRDRKALATLALVSVEDPTAFGLVRTDSQSRITQFLEKPTMNEAAGESWINAGIYVMEPDAVAEIPQGVTSSVERDIFPKFLFERRPFFAYRQPEAYWIDVGTPARYRRVQDDMLHGRFQVAIPGKLVRPGVWVHPTARIGEHVTFGTGVYVGKGARVHDRAAVGDGTVVGEGVVLASQSVVAGSTILNGASVGRGARVINSTVGFKVKIGEAAVVEHDALMGEGTVISPFSRV